MGTEKAEETLKKLSDPMKTQVQEAYKNHSQKKITDPEIIAPFSLSELYQQIHSAILISAYEAETYGVRRTCSVFSVRWNRSTLPLDCGWNGRVFESAISSCARSL